MASPRRFLWLAGSAALLVPRLAAAQEPAPFYRPPVVIQAPEAAPVPSPVPLPALPPNIVTAPDGSVSVSRTPAQGVDVHAPTTSGTVHAYGCNRVDVDASTRAPGAAPCPYAHYPTYTYAYVPPAYYYPPVYYQPPQPPAQPRPAPKPRYAPDPARKGALITASLLFGLGTAGAGGAYIASLQDRGPLTCNGSGSCVASYGNPSKPALYTMGGFLTATPSIPRFVVGDIGMGLLLTALRGGSFAAGAFVDWKDDSHALPVTLAFVVPATLGIIDLATTPHREQLQPKKPADESASSFRLHGVGPTATVDHKGDLAPALGAAGSF